MSVSPVVLGAPSCRPAWFPDAAARRMRARYDLNRVTRRAESPGRERS